MSAETLDTQAKLAQWVRVMNEMPILREMPDWVTDEDMKHALTLLKSPILHRRSKDTTKRD